jgi:hypothetical protein
VSIACASSVRTALLAAAVALSGPAAAEPDATERVVTAIAGDPACRVATIDGEGMTAASTRIVALLECTGGRSQALLLAGAYPIPNSARPGDYRLLDRRMLATTAAVRASLGNGVCTVARRAIAGSSIIVANWRNRSKISGRQIAEFWAVAPGRASLERRLTRAMTCYQDEP